MPRRPWLLFTVLVLVAGSATAQNVQSVLQTTAIAMGMESLTSIRYSGTGWRGRVGQNVSPDRDWPRVELTSYTRTIDFETMSSKEEYVLEQGGRATNLVAGDHAWALDAQGQSLPQPALAEVRRLDNTSSRSKGGWLGYRIRPDNYRQNMNLLNDTSLSEVGTGSDADVESTAGV